ncbi:hypothetical protein RF11_14442 [Thelohanellus kitauei]|uniref:Integrase catalytic domain-containing protein n=1 Tax=Thelohanellus kitauei TaxID=669202 RepID=A0A0C2MVX5_THEKT|nr:hypothetical protein RF11_14442 [Thelohanellus kitauei]
MNYGISLSVYYDIGTYINVTFISKMFSDDCIYKTYTTYYNHQSGGLTERKNLTVINSFSKIFHDDHELELHRSKVTFSYNEYKQAQLENYGLKLCINALYTCP